MLESLQHVSALKLSIGGTLTGPEGPSKAASKAKEKINPLRGQYAGVPISFPPHLTSLSLIGISFGRESTSYDASLFSSLPQSLLSLSMFGGDMHWCKCQDWIWINNREAPATPTWMELLPNSLTELFARGVPVFFGRLPSSLRTLSVLNPTNEGQISRSLSALSAFSIPAAPSAPGDFSAKRVKWPPQLTSLSFNHQPLDPSDAKILPQTLTKLRANVSTGWTQHDVKTLLERLPRCYIYLMHTPENVSSSMILIEDDPASYNRNAVADDSIFDPVEFATLQLSSLPHRIVASWTLEGSQSSWRSQQATPSGIPISTFRSIDVEKPTHLKIPSKDLVPFGRGTLSALTMSLKSTLAAMPNLKTLSSSIASLDPYNASREEQLTTFPISSKLTTIDLPWTGVSLVFSSLPASLTSLTLSWALDEPKEKSGLFQPLQKSEDRHFSNLPCGLVRFDAPYVIIPNQQISGQNWPTEIEFLSFRSDAWSDTQLIALAERFPKLKKMDVFGSVSSNGFLEVKNDEQSSNASCELPSDLSAANDIDSERPLEIRRRGKRKLGEGSLPRDMREVEFHQKTPTPSLSKPVALIDLKPTKSIQTMDFMDSCDISRIHDALSARFGENSKISVRRFSIPSLLCVASPNTTHTVKITTVAKPEFEIDDPPVKNAASIRYPGFAFSGVTRDPEPESASWSNVVCQDRVTLKFIANNYPALTSLTLSVGNTKWSDFSELPSTLKYLACKVCESVNTFPTLPESLEVLRINAEDRVRMDASEMSQLPPNLKILECNALILDPRAIHSTPTGLHTLLFNGDGQWKDIDVHKLKQHLGPATKKISVASCILSGAMLPISSPSGEPRTEFNLNMLIKETNDILGEAVKCTWQSLAEPLQMCFIDVCASQKGPKAVIMAGILENVATLDLQLAGMPGIKGTLICESFPNLTSLSLYLQQPLSASELASLPLQLQHLRISHINAWSSIPAAEYWRSHPRNLKTLSLLYVGLSMGGSDEPMLCIDRPAIFKPIGTPLVSDRQTVRSFVGLPPQLTSLDLSTLLITSACILQLPSSLTELHCFAYQDAGSNTEISQRISKLTIFSAALGTFPNTNQEELERMIDDTRLMSSPYQRNEMAVARTNTYLGIQGGYWRQFMDKIHTDWH